MDSELKFIEGTNFDIDEYFAEKINELSSHERKSILYQIIPILNDLPEVNGWSQLIAGVVKGDNPLYFSVEFLKQVDEIPFLLDLHELDVDEYLDLYLESNTIDTYGRHKQNNDGQGTDACPEKNS